LRAPEGEDEVGNAEVEGESDGEGEEECLLGIRSEDCEKLDERKAYQESRR